MVELFNVIFDGLKQMTFTFFELNISLFDLMILLTIGFMLIKFIYSLID